MADSTIINDDDDGTVDIEDNDGNDSKVPALMRKIAALEQDKSELAHENQVINEGIEKLIGEIEALATEKETLKSETKALDSIAARAAGLETEVSSLQRDLNSSMNESQEANAELVGIKREMEELRKSDLNKGLKLETIEKERNLLLEKIVKDGDGFKESNSRISDLEKKIEALEMRDSNYKIEKVRVEEEMRVKIDEREARIRILQNLVEELEAVMERSNKEREELEIVKNELEALLKKSERRVKEMENKMGILYKELEGSEKMISGLKEKAIVGINGKDVVMERGIDDDDDDDKGLMGLKLEWLVVAASAGSIALVAVLYLRYIRQG